MDPTDNLHSLHAHEEKLRTQSLEVISKDPDLTNHWKMVSEAMNMIYAFSKEYPHESDDELTLQLLGIRLFNAAGASVRLALAGYYQKAFDQLRDVLETYFLVDYLRDNPSKISEWKAADKKARIAHFGPSKIRNALDKRNGFTSGERKRIYDLISEHASHASYPGFSLTTNKDGLGEIGPFFDEKKLRVWLNELATRLCHAAVILAADHEGRNWKLLATRGHYLDHVHEWTARYLISKA